MTSAPRDLALKAPAAATSRRFKMTCMLRNAAISAVAALTVGAGVTTTATPSMAQGWQGHGWHGGGWRGGYWRGGRWYGGGWGGPVAAGGLRGPGPRAPAGPGPSF